MDNRRTPSNGRVAHNSLRGRIDAERFTDGEDARIALPLVDLAAEPGGPRVRQLLMGACFTVLERRDGLAFGQAAADGYVGWLDAGALSAWSGPPTHRVAAPASHLYEAPDIKSPERAALSLDARLRIVGQDDTGRMLRTDTGLYVPAAHLRELSAPAEDPVAIAESLLGTPYLWGGNSRAGLDCSALVQLSCHVCGIPCPGDSDQQEAELGTPLPADSAMRRGDLLFWKGHVAWAMDDNRLIHANAHHMAVAIEPAETARRRIARDGGGPITARKRL